MIDQQVMYGEWEWLLSEDALEASGVWPLKEYIWRWKTSIVGYIANLPIYKLSLGCSGCWYQAGACGGGIRILPRKKRAMATARECKSR